MDVVEAEVQDKKTAMPDSPKVDESVEIDGDNEGEDQSEKQHCLRRSRRAATKKVSYKMMDEDFVEDDDNDEQYEHEEEDEEEDEEDGEVEESISAGRLRRSGRSKSRISYRETNQDSDFSEDEIEYDEEDVQDEADENHVGGRKGNVKKKADTSPLSEHQQPKMHSFFEKFKYDGIDAKNGVSRYGPQSKLSQGGRAGTSRKRSSRVKKKRPNVSSLSRTNKRNSDKNNWRDIEGESEKSGKDDDGAADMESDSEDDEVVDDVNLPSPKGARRSSRSQKRVNYNESRRLSPLVQRDDSSRRRSRRKKTGRGSRANNKGLKWSELQPVRVQASRQKKGRVCYKEPTEADDDFSDDESEESESQGEGESSDSDAGENSEEEEEDLNQVVDDGLKIDKILGTRRAGEGDAAEIEVLVKWKDWPYIDTEWISKDDALQRLGQSKRRLSEFMRKEKQGLVGKAEDGSYFDPDYVVIERILDRRPRTNFDDDYDDDNDAAAADDDSQEKENGKADNLEETKKPALQQGGEQPETKTDGSAKSKEKSESDLAADDEKKADDEAGASAEMDMKGGEQTTESSNSASANEAKVHEETEFGGLVVPSEDDIKNYEYLVKWMKIPYDQMTWEVASKLNNGPRKVAEYLTYVSEKGERIRKARKAARVATRIGRRKSFTEFTESPDFGGGRKLRDYQLEGLNWLAYSWHNRRNSILADEMGLGKTVQTVSLLRYLQREMEIPGPFLVVVPLSTIAHWQREVEGWTDMRCVVYHGNADTRDWIRSVEWAEKPCPSSSASRRFAPTQAFKFQVIITTYEMVISDLSHLEKIHWKCLVVDEAHRLKNEEARLYQDLQTMMFDHCVFLTGTPIQNRSRELGALLHFLEEEKFPCVDEFEQEYGDMKSKKDVEKLQKVLKPYLLRRVKGDVEKALPPRVETLIEVELTGTQKRWYRAVFERNVECLLGPANLRTKTSLNNLAMQLRKCCNHPYLMEGAEEAELKGKELSPDEVMEELILASGKTVLLNKLLPKLKKDGHRVLIFSQMCRTLDILEDYLSFMNYSFERLDGGISGPERQAAIDRYSKDDSRFAFLLSTRSGGVGINLTAADTVIIFDSDWNPQNDIQAQARCHRIGQTRKVQVYRLITRNTYEQQMFNAASKKLGLDRALLGTMTATVGKASSSSSSSLKSKKPEGLAGMKKEEVEALLKHGAYHVFLANSDDAERQFCEDDIDSILANRSKELVFDDGKSSSKDNALSAFSKASFVPTSEGSSVDINDPDFWTKLGVTRTVQKATLARKRSRKKVDHFGMSSHGDMPSYLKGRDGDFEVEDDDGEEDSAAENGSAEDFDDQEESLYPDAFKTWASNQRDIFYAKLCEFGFFRWNKIRKASGSILDGKSDDDMAKYACAVLKMLLEAQSAKTRSNAAQGVKKPFYEKILAYVRQHFPASDTNDSDKASKNKITKEEETVADKKLPSEQAHAKVAVTEENKAEGGLKGNSVSAKNASKTEEKSSAAKSKIAPKSDSTTAKAISSPTSSSKIKSKTVTATAKSNSKENDNKTPASSSAPPPNPWIESFLAELSKMSVDASLVTPPFTKLLRRRCKVQCDIFAQLHILHRLYLSHSSRDVNKNGSHEKKVNGFSATAIKATPEGSKEGDMVLEKNDIEPTVDDQWVGLKLPDSFIVKRTKSDITAKAPWWVRDCDIALLEGIYNLGVSKDSIAQLGSDSNTIFPKLLAEKETEQKPKKDDSDKKEGDDKSGGDMPTDDIKNTSVQGKEGIGTKEPTEKESEVKVESEVKEASKEKPEKVDESGDSKVVASDNASKRSWPKYATLSSHFKKVLRAALALITPKTNRRKKKKTSKCGESSGSCTKKKTITKSLAKLSAKKQVADIASKPEKKTGNQKKQGEKRKLNATPAAGDSSAPSPPKIQKTGVDKEDKKAEAKKSNLLQQKEPPQQKPKPGKKKMSPLTKHQEKKKGKKRKGLSGWLVKRRPLVSTENTTEKGNEGETTSEQSTSKSAQGENMKPGKDANGAERKKIKAKRRRSKNIKRSSLEAKGSKTVKADRDPEQNKEKVKRKRRRTGLDGWLAKTGTATKQAKSENASESSKKTKDLTMKEAENAAIKAVANLSTPSSIPSNFSTDQIMPKTTISSAAERHS